MNLLLYLLRKCTLWIMLILTISFFLSSYLLSENEKWQENQNEFALKSLTSMKNNSQGFLNYTNRLSFQNCVERDKLIQCQKYVKTVGNYDLIVKNINQSLFYSIELSDKPSNSWRHFVAIYIIFPFSLILIIFVIVNNWINLPSDERELLKAEENKKRTKKQIEESEIEVAKNKRIKEELELKLQEENSNINDLKESLKIKEIIDKGESHYVEFKSTLRYSINDSKKDRSLEFDVVKAIVAFLNSHTGGTLFIGIKEKDNKTEIIGLEKDYSTFSNPNFDVYTRTLNRAIDNYTNKDVHQYLDIEEKFISKKEICMIKIRPSKNPILLKKGNDEMFYVRINKESVQLVGTKMMDYIEKRFNN